MMRRFAVPLLAVVVATAGMTVTAEASSIDIGVFGPCVLSINCSGTFAPPGPGGTVKKGSFTDTYTFTAQDAEMFVGATVTNAFTVKIPPIQNLSISLWSAGGVAPIASATPSLAFNSIGLFSPIKIAPGGYYFEITGNSLANGSPYAGTYVFSAAAPLPAAPALFALGLGGLWWLLRKRSAVAAV